MVVEAQVRTAKRVTGGSFLIEDLTPEDIFTRGRPLSRTEADR